MRFSEPVAVWPRSNRFDESSKPAERLLSSTNLRERASMSPSVGRWIDGSAREPSILLATRPGRNAGLERPTWHSASFTLRLGRRLFRRPAGFRRVFALPGRLKAGFQRAHQVDNIAACWPRSLGDRQTLLLFVEKIL